MVRFLIADGSAAYRIDTTQLRCTDGKCRVAILPGEVVAIGLVLAEPFGGIGFDGAERFGDRNFRWDVYEEVDMVGHPVDFEA